MLEPTDFKKGAIILVDKPLEWTSFNVVAKIRYALRRKYGVKKFKVGHAGTLDPLATGLLIICTGRFTKKIPELQDGIKEYAGIIRLGTTTPSYDLETEVDKKFPTEHITEEMIHSAAASFEGDIDQTPPIFSAKKVDGKRAYDMARKGESVTLKKSRVRIEHFDVTKISFPDVHFRIVCSKGTYIRSMAHDLGTVLNSGGHLIRLRRTKSGDFNVEDALGIDDAVKFVEDFAVNIDG